MHVNHTKVCTKICTLFNHYLRVNPWAMTMTHPWDMQSVSPVLVSIVSTEIPQGCGSSTKFAPYCTQRQQKLLIPHTTEGWVCYLLPALLTQCSISKYCADILNQLFNYWKQLFKTEKNDFITASWENKITRVLQHWSSLKMGSWICRGPWGGSLHPTLFFTLHINAPY